MTVYSAAESRYDTMKYRRCGQSGIKLPSISLGLWQNFGAVDSEENCRSILLKAFDRGITHFDLANNYGPPYGSAEETFAHIYKRNFVPYRDELLISSKAGYDMWSGPYGNWGSRKYIIASCEQSLKRMGLEYVDIFYHHRPDPDTPVEESMGALALLVRQGKALYAGISNYNAEQTAAAVRVLRDMGVPCLIHQASYSMLNRWTENGLLDVLEKEGMGCICFSPLSQGLLTGRYLDGTVPSGSRASKAHSLKPERLTPALLKKLRALNDIAQRGGRTLARMAIAWILRDGRNTSVLMGAGSVNQLEENLSALDDAPLSAAELTEIDTVLKMPDV